MEAVDGRYHESMTLGVVGEGEEDRSCWKSIPNVAAAAGDDAYEQVVRHLQHELLVFAVVHAVVVLRTRQA